MKKILTTCAVLGLILTGCTQTNTAVQTSSSAQTTSTVTSSPVTTNAKKTDSAEITLKNGSKIKVIINKVTSTEERNDEEKTDPNQVIMLDFGYTNISSSDDIEINSSMFRVYDQNNALATLYNLDSGRNYGYIKKGTTLANADLFYALVNESTYVTIDFRCSGTATGDPDASFTIQVQEPQ